MPFWIYSDLLNTFKRESSSPNAEVQIRFTLAQIQETRGSHVSILGCSLCTFKFPWAKYNTHRIIIWFTNGFIFRKTLVKYVFLRKIEPLPSGWWQRIPSLHWDRLCFSEQWSSAHDPRWTFFLPPQASPSPQRSCRRTRRSPLFSHIPKTHCRSRCKRPPPSSSCLGVGHRDPSPTLWSV